MVHKRLFDYLNADWKKLKTYECSFVLKLQMDIWEDKWDDFSC